MATPWRTVARPSGQTLLHGSSASDDEFYDRENNDRLLQRAINYLIKEGGSDPTATYIERVQRIDEGIVQELRNQHYPYNPQLYRQLRSLVHEVRADFESVAGEESSVNIDDSDLSMEEVNFPEALYRDNDSDMDPESSSTSSGPRTAEVLETQFLYGGPNNDLEEWHKDFPAVLPFGETLYMQQWEGMKIDYDLAESAKKHPDDDNPLVTTNVPYAAVEARFGKPSHHLESGSRFKIPTKVWKTWDEIVKAARDMVSLDEFMEEFNLGGDPEEQRDKDYAPRVFLPQVSLDARHRRPSSTRAWSHNTGEQHTPTPAPRRRSASRSNPGVKLPQTTAFRKFDRRRNAVTRDPSAAVARSTAALSKKDTPNPASRAVGYVQAGPSTSRTLKHPRKTAVEGTQLPATTAAILKTNRKRKVSDAAYIPSPTHEPPTKKGKRTPAMKTTKKPSPVKKSVAFADKPISSPPKPKNTFPVKKAPVKRKGKEAKSVPEVLSKDVRAVARSVKRGTTRSGIRFK